MQKSSLNYLIIFSALYFFGPNAASGQITFTEVMNNPATNENHDEFVEIYNLSGNTVDLSGWVIADSTSQDIIIDAGHGLWLNPNRYAVILDGSYSGNSTTYDQVIPDTALIVQVDGGTITSRLSNSKNQTLFLLNSVMDTIDHYTFIATYNEGYSNEKIELEAGNDSSNWAQSLFPGGTPGLPNSVFPVANDIGFNANAINWSEHSKITSSTQIDLSISIFNFGTQPFKGNLSLRLYHDSNQDSSFSAGEAVFYNITTAEELAAENYLEISIDLIFDKGGAYNLVAELNDINDENALNNRVFFKIVVYDINNKLHINEIKFLATENEAECLELYNSDDQPIALNGWAIADDRDTAMIDTFAFIQPDEYKILSSAPGLDSLYNINNSSIIILNDMPSFNNSEDIIYLINPAGNWLEQVPYSEDWLEGEQWRLPSMERINVQLDSRQASNWGPSTSEKMATPTKSNSIFTSVEFDLKSKLIIKPNPFSPNGDGYDDYTLIQVELPIRSARIKVEVYDILGRRVRTLRDNYFSGSQSSLVWNGEDNSGRRVRMGIYIVFVQILNDREGLIKELKKTVVVAKPL